jgi:CBS domain-containing protein
MDAGVRRKKLCREERHMKVADILNTKGASVITVRPEETALDLAERLRAERIGAAIVSADGRTIDGIVSERDVAYALAAHASRLPQVLVETLMTKVVVVCSPEDSIKQVMSVMTRERVRHLPVKNGDVLVGIISIGDVLKHRLSEMQMEADVLRDYARVQR